ncbi:MAG: NAD(P)/FAD-dependent oxidoreductase [Achromobacter pulmonis]|uniref:Gamma-glutamylputrescine oxidoreductase n=1 Tax=Achromobacter pulmonis TaxID=1389932 RepID=A0A6S7EFK4_9BURK|nr:FAD-binding oxidoreductase [Achromobacter pulmonis]MCF7771304.1 FAD-binding oxidoreductase [Achromobacter pulmonis]MPT28214.1 FAD-binding oxidoreductase [Achromobacter sp.]CAB3658616.1 Gamma-glutamylputrescine oxidoreductase [Achromobacter pulmonis]CAB3908100.1 Gamma-glutamylputrescine oxidoreductase [Achromobacter pulmonis]
MSQTPFPLAPSLWAATAAPPPDTQPLAQSAQADVLVVGGGYAGLSTALHLAEQGVRVALLEAREIGFGGSGRNGGQVIPGLKYDPDALVSMFGAERGERLVRFAGATADAVFNLIERHAMDVPHVRRGWIQGAHNPAALKLAHARAAQWARHGADAQPLDKAEVTRLIGTDRYLGGWVDRRAGAVQPLSYARGLARAALNAGAVIHTDTPVTRLQREGGKWVATTAGGARVTAERVVMCTNAYGADLLPGLKPSIIDANTFQVATPPLPERVRAGIFPEGHVTSDTRNLLLYFRLDHQGRLLMGGRGPFREPRGAQDWAHLERVMVKMFPQVAGTPFEYRWCGRVAITRDYLPHLHEPQPGLLVDIGCQGRGVGLQTSMGRAMAQYLVSGDPKALPVPLSPIKPFPLYGLRRLYVNAVVTWYRMTDGGV